MICYDVMVMMMQLRLLSLPMCSRTSRLGRHTSHALPEARPPASWLLEVGANHGSLETGRKLGQPFQCGDASGAVIRVSPRLDGETAMCSCFSRPRHEWFSKQGLHGWMCCCIVAGRLG